MSSEFSAEAISAFVDNEPVDPRQVAGLHQRDPFPGGHRFQIVITDDMRGMFPYLTDGKNPDADIHFSKIFAMVGGYLDAVLDRDGHLGSNEQHWFLNRIENAHLTDAKLVLEGVCSPVIRD